MAEGNEPQPNAWSDVPLSDFFESTSLINTSSNRTSIKRNGKKIIRSAYGISNHTYNKRTWFTLKSAYRPIGSAISPVANSGNNSNGLLWINGETGTANLTDDIAVGLPITSFIYLIA